MAATFTFKVDHGTATGSPAVGASTSTAAAINWLNDDSEGTNTTFPITAGLNSFEKFLYFVWSGTFTTISSVLWAHTAGTFGTGLTLKGVVTSTYSTPSTTTNSALTTDMTSAISIGAGASVLISATSPAGVSPGSSSSANPCYGQYCPTQLQTTSGAAAGLTVSATFTAQYDES